MCLMNIIIYGTKKCAATRKAERFLKERRIPVQFRDLAEKPLSEGELRNLVSGHKAAEMIDTESGAYEKRGLAFMEYDPFEEILANNLLLKTPIIRLDKKSYINPDMNDLPL